MNGKERLDSYLAGAAVDRRPNLTIVGGVVTQYGGIDIETYCKDYKAMTACAVRCAQDARLDFIQIASDLVREAEAFGSAVAYFPDKLPTVKKYALDDISDALALRPLNIRESPRVYDLVKATAYAQTLCDSIYPMTLAVGPATVAGNLRGVENLMMDVFDEEDACRHLFNVVTETALDLIHELAAVGCRCMYVADPVASLLSPAMYEAFILPCHKRIFAEMKRHGMHSRLHMCGNTEKTLPFSSACGADIIDIDHAVRYDEALKAVQGRCLLNGNIDPVADVFSCDAAHTRAAIIAAADTIGRARGLFMPGCELPARTPLDNLKAIAEALDVIGS